MTWVWNHSRSRHGARLVLLAIADCASGDGGNAWPSNAELQRKAGLGERAVQSAIGELAKLGELEVRYNDGPGGCNRYRVIMGDPRNICTPAESAPPQISQEPPQILHPPPAESAPVTVLEPKANQHQKTSSSGAARGARIPDDFAVTADMADWARREAAGLIAAGRGKSETDRFVDYWRSVAGTKGRKLDWIAVWRNWMRRADDDMGARPQQRPAPKTTTNDRVQQAIEAGKRVQAMMGGES